MNAPATCFLLFTCLVGCARPEASHVEAPRVPAPDVLLRTGDAAAASGDTARAEQYFATAREAGAPEHEVLRRLVEVCVQAGRFRSAILHLESYLRRHPEAAELRYLVATLHWAVGDQAAAAEELGRVLSQRPDHESARFSRGALRVEMGLPNAAEDLQLYLELAPRGAHAVEAAGFLDAVSQPPRGLVRPRHVRFE